MASSALTGSLLKFLKAGPTIARRSSPGGLRALVTGAPGAPGSFEGADPQMKDSAGPVENAANETRGMASSAAAREVIDETIDEADSLADQAKEKAQDIGEKAKQTVQDVWGSAKETAQKVKDTVVGKAEDAKDYIKEKAHAVDETIDSAVRQGERDAKTLKKAANNPEAVEKAMNTKNC